MFTGWKARATSDRAAALLAFGARVASTAIAVAAEATTATATPPAESAAIAPAFTVMVLAAAFVRLAAVGAGLAIARATVVAAIPAASASAAVAAMAALIAAAAVVATVVAAFAFGGSGGRLGFFAAEEAFEPADDAARFFLLGFFGGGLPGLLFARLVAARLAGLALLERTSIAAIVTATIITTVAAAITAETATVFATRLVAARRSGRFGRLPADDGAPGLFGRENVELGFFRRRRGGRGGSRGCGDGGGRRGFGRRSGRSGSGLVDDPFDRLRADG